MLRLVVYNFVVVVVIVLKNYFSTSSNSEQEQRNLIISQVSDFCRVVLLLEVFALLLFPRPPRQSDVILTQNKTPEIKPPFFGGIFF